MVDTAFDVLPYCQGIRGDSRLSKPTAFEGCFRILTGDFAAAAGALPLFYRALDVLRSEIVDVDKSRKVLTELIVTRPSNGSPVPGSGQTKINRPNEMVDLLLQGSIGLRGITGIDANLAEIEVIQFQRGKAQTDEKAPRRSLKMFAVREQGEFRIAAIEASDFQPAPIASEATP